jgi:hypothetical protein
MNYFPSRFFLIIFVLQFISNVSSEELNIPQGLLSKKPGSYDLKVKSSLFRFAKDKTVLGVFSIPAGISAEDLSAKPLIVFYHGNSRNANTYKEIAFLTKWSVKYKFPVLSIQNWWSLSKDMVEGAEDSRLATNLLLNRLKDESLFDSGKVYPIGFSAGGFTAILVFFNSIRDPLMQFSDELPENAYIYDYAGVGSFKGNYYPSYIQISPALTSEENGITKFYQNAVGSKILYLSMGGKKDAPRVQTQVPEAVEFFTNYLGLSPILEKFPDQGHLFSDKEWESFWKKINEK